MLIFPNEYFQSEYREDFLVDTTMKTVWAAEMELLSDIAAVCEKYHLQYYAYWGTLLGAVRHKGFVPWDDDMDIALKREDYNVLMNVLPKELPETYQVSWGLSEAGRDRFWGCVSNADTISIEEDRLKKFHGCPFMVGIDVVPLDYIPRDPNEALVLHSFMTLIHTAVYIAKKTEKTLKEEEKLEELLVYLGEHLKVEFDPSKSLPNQLWRVGNLLASKYGEEDGDFLTLHTTEIKYENFRYPKEWWSKAIEMPYETITVPVPIGYDEVLKKIYGDYHVRVRGKLDHNYPYYEEQLRELREKVKVMEERASK